MRNRVKTGQREPEAKTQELQDQNGCCHYWLIESPNGPKSRGVCKFCGAEKDFPNSPPEFTLYKRDTGNSEPPDSPDKESDEEKSGP